MENARTVETEGVEVAPQVYLNSRITSLGSNEIESLQDFQVQLKAAGILQEHGRSVGIAAPLVLARTAVRKIVNSSGTLLKRSDAALARLNIGMETLLEALRLPQELRRFAIAEPPRVVNVSRTDFLYSNEGWRCHEFNRHASLGGLEIGKYNDLAMENDVLGKVLRELRADYADPRKLVMKRISQELDKLPALNNNTVAIVDWDGFLRARYENHLETAQAYERAGYNVVLSDCSDLEFARGTLTVGGVPVAVVHREVLLEDLAKGPEWRQSLPMLEAAAAGAIVMVSSIRSELLGTKLAFAYLWSAVISGDHETAERLWIDRWVPRTSMVENPALSSEPSIHRLSAPLTSDSWRHLVLKPALGSESRGLTIGREVSTEAFSAQLAATRAGPAYVLQDFISSRSVQLPEFTSIGALSLVEHHLNLGVFHVDGKFGGLWLRARPVTDQDRFPLARVGGRYAGVFWGVE